MHRQSDCHSNVVAGNTPTARFRSSPLRLLPLPLLLACLVAALAACSTAAPTATPAPSPTATATAPPATATATPRPLPPVLDPARNLARNCEQYRSFVARPMVPGQLAVDFTLTATTGISYTLSDLLADKPVIMIFGSFT